MNKQNIVFNIVFSIVLILAWSAILFATFILWLISDVFRLFGNGMLMYVFAFIYALTFIIPIIFRKRIVKYIPLVLSFAVCTIFSVIIVGFVLVGAKSYISVFTQEKWDNNEQLRSYMIDDLEEKHQIVGKTKDEIIELIGEPTYSYDNFYEYLIGYDIIDNIGYQIEFEDNVAKNTTVVVH